MGELQENFLLGGKAKHAHITGGCQLFYPTLNVRLVAKIQLLKIKV
jgi:hypothetical protein